MDLRTSAVARPWLLLRPLWDRLHGTPAVLHVTHWKAGSQWIRRILRQSCPSRFVMPSENNDHVLKGTISPGLVYPTIYATREQLQHIAMPSEVRRFVVIRDPRDAIVSMYFSEKISHNGVPIVARRRAVLQKLNVEDGLKYVIGESVAIADIIRSWLGGPDPLIRYEDLLKDDEAILTRVLIDHCQMPVSKKRLRAVIHANRFECLTRGRARGQEDIRAHERKGVAGDWRNHFTEPVKDAFKQHYGEVLIAAGYERDHNW